MKVKIYIQLLILFLFYRVGDKLYAQTFPVTITTQLTPPFTGYLPDYSAAGMEKLRVLLLFNDFTKPVYNIKLKIKISGQGINIESKSYYFEGPYTIEPGVPLQISGSDLGALLNSNNLDFSGISQSQYEQRKVLPEGFYSVCITAYDYNNPNNIKVSNESCAYGMMILSDPPYLNLPGCGASLNVINPQQITFNWTPINMASPNSANQTDYVLELFEVRPAGQNPNNIVQTLPPIFTETLTTTTFNYGITEPPLIMGMEYVWRVRAVDQSGRDLFKNQGYSQICTFTWGSQYTGANLNINLAGVPVTHRQIKCTWDSLNVYDNYKLEFKKVGGTNNWFPLSTTNSRAKITSLEPNTDYNVHVSGQLPDGSWGPQSNEITIRTPAAPVYNCGDMPMPLNAQNFKPLIQAGNFQIWDIGQFEVLVTSLENFQSPTGQYSGKGNVIMGFAGGASFPVTFTNVTVSSDMMVVAGRMDVRSRGIDNWLSQQNVGSQYVYDDSYVFNGCIDSVFVNSNNQISIVDCNGNITTIPGSYDGGILIQDANGNQWIVNSNGTVTPVGGTTLPLTAIPLTADELDILKKALGIIKNQYSNSIVNALKQQMQTKSQDLDSYINTQFQPYNVGASGSTTTDVEYMGFVYDNTLTGQGVQKNKDYKQKEFEYNAARILNVFSREENTTAEYNFIGKYLTVGSKAYKTFVAEEKAKNRTHNDIASDVAQLGIKPLGEAAAKRKMKFD